MDDALRAAIQTCLSEKPTMAKEFEWIFSEGWNTGRSKLEGHSETDATIIAYHLRHKTAFLNEHFRNGLEPDTQCKALLTQYLDTALEKIAPFAGIVYRMDNPNNSDERELAWFRENINKTILVKHYLSTSLQNWQPSLYPVVWRIYTLRENSFARDLSSINTSEREVLFKRNSKFRIVGVDQEDSTIILLELPSDTDVDIELVKSYSGK